VPLRLQEVAAGLLNPLLGRTRRPGPSSWRRSVGAWKSCLALSGSYLPAGPGRHPYSDEPFWIRPPVAAVHAMSEHTVVASFFLSTANANASRRSWALCPGRARRALGLSLDVRHQVELTTSCLPSAEQQLVLLLRGALDADDIANRRVAETPYP